MWVVRLLKEIVDKLKILKPKRGMLVSVHANSYYLDICNKGYSYDQYTTISRHGFVVSFEGLPIIWKYQLQT